MNFKDALLFDFLYLSNNFSCWSPADQDSRFKKKPFALSKFVIYYITKFKNNDILSSKVRDKWDYYILTVNSTEFPFLENKNYKNKFL